MIISKKRTAGALLLILVVSFIIVLTTEVGTRFTLGLLGRVAGLELRGISGDVMREFTVKHLEFHNEDVDLIAEDVALQWQPGALWDHQLIIDRAQVNSLAVIVKPSKEPTKLPTSLTLPSSISLVNADQLSVNYLQVQTKPNGKPLELSALKADLHANSSAYQLHISGTTPWGAAAIAGSLEGAAPFKTQAHIDWKSLAMEQHGIAIPATILRGDVSGNLSKLSLEARAENAQTSGTIQTVITPFNFIPVDTLQVDLNSVNPANFYPNAPKASLHIVANLKTIGDANSPALTGQIAIKNATPSPWNTGGIPVANLRSEITVDEHQLKWDTAKIDIGDGELESGTGRLTFGKNIPDIATIVEVKNVNLLRIDSRLKRTQLNGKIQISRPAGLQFGVQVQDTQPNLHAKLIANLELSPEQVLNLKKIELLANDAAISAQGNLALRGKQEFSIQGETHQFNPARWIDVPNGRIAARFKAAGQLQQGWLVDAQMSELTGQFAGMELKGESNVIAQEGKSLAVKKLDVTWGKNTVTAQGSFSVGASKSQSHAAHPHPLHFKLVVPDLAAISHPFEKVVQTKLQGAFSADGAIAGDASQPSGYVNVNANNIVISDFIKLEKLSATAKLADGAEGKMEGNVDITGVLTDSAKIDRIQASLNGTRHAHQLNLFATFPRKYQVEFQAKGDLRQAKWQGQVHQMNLIGPNDLALMAPFALNVSSKEVQMGQANWQGKLGKLQVQKINWTEGKLATRGQLIGLPVANALRLARSSLPLIGNLQVDAQWQADIGRHVSGQFEIKRTSGDIVVQDVSSGHSQTTALGLNNLQIKGRFGDAATGLNQPFTLQLQAQGTQLGIVEANLGSVIRNTDHGWSMPVNVPVSGAATMHMNDIQWMSQWLGSGVSLHGEMQLKANLAGTLEKPDYSVKLSGQKLDVSLTELGVLLPHGTLEASLESGAKLKLGKLAFSQAIKAPPKHEQLSNLPWLNETGNVSASGEIDLHSGRGSIATHWHRFPFLQRPDDWLVASGDAQLTQTEKVWNLTGNLIADAAYFSVPKQAAPKLSSDVIVLKKDEKREEGKSAGIRTNVDFNIKLGNNFVFVGRGLNTSLGGDLRIRIQNDGPVFASGTIQTVGGTYDGYGQQLSIERGILNFQGPLDNPGLNVRALRKGLTVEAGVEIIGTVAKPEVRLISEPNVPDEEKLSWLVLGRGADQVGGADASLLIAAGTAILGGEGSSNISRSIAQTFGLDELSISSVGSSPESQLPAQTVAGNIGNNSTNDQVFSVGKRITPDLILSVERSLNDAGNGIKLTWKLTQRFSIIGRAGADNAIDGQYVFSFNNN